MDEDARSGRNRILVKLERVDAVLERVLDAHGPPRQLARLPGGDESAAEPHGERAAQNEASGLGAEHEIRSQRLGERGEPLDGLGQRRCIREQRHDVLEDDARPGKVRYIADLRFEIDRHERATSARRARQKRSCESSIERPASFSRSSSPAWRRSGFRE